MMARNQSSQKVHLILIFLGLSLLVLAVFRQVGGHSFVNYDDEKYIYGNPHVSRGLTLEGLSWAFTSDMDAGWIPLTWLSRMADVSLFGMDAGRHHLVNVLFHLLNTFLLFVVMRKMTGKLWESGLVAALFAVHPLHVESVAWAVERKDVLAGFFWMLSMGAYVRYAVRPGAVRYGLVTLFFVLGLLSKPIVVTLPFVLLLLDFWPLGRLWPSGEPQGDGGVSPPFRPASPGRLVMEKFPLIVLSAAISAVTILAHRNISAVTPLKAIPLWARLGNALQAYAAYIRKAVWPSDLAVFYPHPGTNLVLWKTSVAGLFLCVATVLVLRWARQRRWLATGWFWYLGTLVPVIGLVQAGGQAMADRYTYIPLTGLFLVAVWGSRDFVSGIGRTRAAYAAAWGAIVLCLTAASYVQTGYWWDSMTLFTRTLKVTEDNWLAHNNMGDLLLERGKAPEAIPHLLSSLRIYPGYAKARSNLGRAYWSVGRKAEGEAQCREVLRLYPGNVPARINLAVILADGGRNDEAILHLREVIRNAPDHWAAYYNLGILLRARDGGAEALAMFREASRLNPRDDRIRRQIQEPALWNR
jgi:tetratricopeptide (TPR) repeat protein